MRGVSGRVVAGVEAGRSRRVSLGLVLTRVGGGWVTVDVVPAGSGAGLVVGAVTGAGEERGEGFSLRRRGRGWGSGSYRCGRVLLDGRSGAPRMGRG